VYSSDKTNAQKVEISTKTDVYSYRRAHRCDSWGSLKGLLDNNIQHRAVNLLKSLAHPQIAGILYRSHIIALDLFCCHCTSCPYLHGVRFLQLCPVIQRSLRKSGLCKLSQMVVKKLKSTRKPSIKFWLLT